MTKITRIRWESAEQIEDSVRCKVCALVRLLEQPAGAPCVSCGGELVETRSDDRAIPFALFRWFPDAQRARGGKAIEIRWTRVQLDAAVRHGERCGCGHCLDCVALYYWIEARRRAGAADVGELYPVDVEDWDASPT